MKSFGSVNALNERFGNGCVDAPAAVLPGARFGAWCAGHAELEAELGLAAWARAFSGSELASTATVAAGSSEWAVPSLDALCGAESRPYWSCSGRWLRATPKATAMPASAKLAAIPRTDQECQAEARGERRWSTHAVPRSFPALRPLCEVMPEAKQEPGYSVFFNRA